MKKIASAMGLFLRSEAITRRAGFTDISCITVPTAVQEHACPATTSSCRLPEA